MFADRFVAVIVNTDAKLLHISRELDTPIVRAALDGLPDEGYMLTVCDLCALSADAEINVFKFLDSIGESGIGYDIENIRDYCARTSTVPTRNVESDIQRCAVQWIKNGKQRFVLDHIV